MYKSSETIKNIDRFIPIKNGCVIKNKQKELYLLNNNYLICKDVFDFFTYEKYLIYNEESSCCIYNLELNIANCKQNQFALNLKLATSNHWLFTDTTTNLLLFENNFDLDNERLLIKNYDWEFLYLTIDFLYTYNSKNIKSLSLLTGEYEWELDLGAYCTFVQDNETRQGNINSIIGVYQEQLWLMCSNRRLLGLCIYTGKTLSNVWLGDLRSELQNLVVLSPPIIDEANNQFIFCTYQYYFTINASTLTLSIFHKIPFEGRADNIQTQTIYNNLVYFTGQHYLPDDKYESQVGVYDPVNNAILWTYGINEIINQIPQVTDDKLYILDTGGTLHIFEKEQY